jgi:hypothetical protein
MLWACLLFCFALGGAWLVNLLAGSSLRRLDVSRQREPGAAGTRANQEMIDARRALERGSAGTSASILSELNYGELPLSFEANLGQRDSEVKFYARGNGYGLFLTPDSAVLALTPRPRAGARSNAGLHQTSIKETNPEVLRLRLIGGETAAKVTGESRLPGNANYFIGNDPAMWRTNVPTYASVRYENVYPGIDLTYYGNHRRLEYDFILAPGSKLETIRLDFQTARRLQIAPNGDLIITTGSGGAFRQHAPQAYQQIDDRKVTVGARYIIKSDHEVTFAAGDYDLDQPLVIDPVLDYSSYIGGAGSDDCVAIAVDASGNAYLTGYTFSADFPVTPGSFQTKPGSSSNAPIKDAFVMKLNAAGNGAIYSTYLGGNTTPQQPSSGYDEARGIAVDADGNAYVTGLTAASNFPTTPGAFQPAWAAGYVNGFAANDAFLTKLSAAGNSLIYSTYLGGKGTDEAYAIALDSNNNAYVTGSTDSIDFPKTAGVVQPANAGGQDLFVSKLNASGTGLVFSTYLGGAGPDWGNAIAVDAAANVFVTGATVGPDAPVTPGAFPTTAGAFRVGSSGMYDGFVTKLNNNATGLIYSTYLGGIGQDTCFGLAIDPQGHAYVTGSTESDNFPVTPGAYRTTLGGPRYLNNDIFVSKLNDLGSQLEYSTYISSLHYGSNEVGTGLALNANGEVYVVGFTDSNQFPVTADAVQKVVSDNDNAIVVKLNATGSDLSFSTFLGGNGQDGLHAVALDPSGAVYVAGFSHATDFPTTPGSFRPFTSGGYFDRGGIVAKIGAPPQNVFSIGGQVVDTSNHGIAATMVKLTGSMSGSQWTDAQGNYSFGNLPANGNYVVEVVSPYYDFNPPNQTFNNLIANQTASFTGTVRRYSISGQLVGEGGSPLSGFSVFLNGAQPVLTDSNGNYSFNNLSAVGTYTVTPSKEHYFFIPYAASFTSLPGNQTANFTGYQYFLISGHVENSSTKTGLQGIKVSISGSQSSYQYTDYNGNYSFGPLVPGGTYTITIDETEFSFSPASQTFSNLGADQTQNFSGVSKFGNLSGRVVDQFGQGIYSVKVNLTGPISTVGSTDGSGNFTFYHLRKGTTYQIAASMTGYSFVPGTTTATVAGDENAIGLLVAQFNQLRPFTSGNILATAGKFLTEYSLTGTVRQTVIVPFPSGTAQYGYYLGDLVLDQGGEVEIYNGSDPASYLSGYGFNAAAWRQHTYQGWNPWTLYNAQEGIATQGNYVYVTDKTTNDFGMPQTPGIIRISLLDYSYQRFFTDTTFCHLTMGQDGLLYAIVGGTSGYQLNAYSPSTMSLVKTVSLGGAQNVTHVAVTQAGEIFATAFDVFHFSPTGQFVKSIRLPDILNDIEISNNGQIAVVNGGNVTFLDESLNVLSSFPATAGAGYLAFTNNVPTPTTAIKFASASYTVSEGAGTASVTISRVGDTTNAATVEYVTSDGTAQQAKDYTAGSGTLSFAAGETSKTLSVLITDNGYVDGDRTIGITLSNAKGAPLVTPSAATLTITDNDTSASPANPDDNSQFFVRQHYLDFLGRDPDPGGLGFWAGLIEQCNGDANCIRSKRVDVSNAFFYELEYQQTGSYVYRLYRAAFGNSQPFPNPIPDGAHPGEERKVVAYRAFVQDRARVIGGADLPQSQLNLANAFVGRGEFLAKYAATLDGPGFVDAVLATIKNDIGANLAAQRTALIALYDSGGRGAVMYRLADDNTQTNPINNRAFIDAEYNRAFVATQYFGYLRRDPDIAGFLFWLGQVSAAPIRDVTRQHAMVCSFITSAEYQLRFSAVVTHSNSECQ